MKKSFLMFSLLFLSLVSCGKTAPSKYAVNIPTVEGVSISSDKNEYEKGDKVQLSLEFEEKYYMVKNSLKYDDTIIDETLSFTMPNKDVTISIDVMKDELPDNQIYGARFTGSRALSNMAMISLPNISLTNVSALIVEVRFNKMIDNFWMRPMCGTSDAIIYDAFAKATKNSYLYSCEKDHPNAVGLYPWSTSSFGGWVPSWDNRFYKCPPTFYIEVPIESFFSRFYKYGQTVANPGQPLTSDKQLDTIGLHITGDSAQVDFTLGSMYVRRNGIVEKICSPDKYLTHREEGFNYVSVSKIDSTGITQSSLKTTIYNNYKEKPHTAMVLGDSIFTQWWTEDTVKEIGDVLDANVIRDTIGATTIARRKDTAGEDNSIMSHKNNGVYDRYFEQYDNIDYILIQRASNDVWCVAHSVYELGNVDTTDNTTAMGAIKEILNYFKMKAPQAKIVIANAKYRADGVADSIVKAYNSELKKVVDSVEGVTYFDVYEGYGINENNWEEYLNSASHPHHNGSAPDNLHPNTQGYLKIKETWVNFLKSL